eukprot:COSAG01_NODE_978_length_12357_cov_10.838554_9_plen_41_part_00
MLDLSVAEVLQCDDTIRKIRSDIIRGAYDMWMFQGSRAWL